MKVKLGGLLNRLNRYLLLVMARLLRWRYARTRVPGTWDLIPPAAQVFISLLRQSLISDSSDVVWDFIWVGVTDGPQQRLAFPTRNSL